MTIKRDLIKPLIDLNRGVRSLYPSLKLDFERAEDQSATAQALSSYVDRGMPVAVADIRERFGLRQPDPGEPILHPAVRINESVQGNPPADDAMEPGFVNNPSNAAQLSINAAPAANIMIVSTASSRT